VKIQYYYGRKDNTQCDGGSTRLPDGLKGLSHIETVFLTQMGLTMKDAVALIGGHSVGHMSPQNSGFGLDPTDPRNNGELSDNAWDSTPDELDNRFYAEMLNVKWDKTVATSYHQQEYSQPGGRVLLNTDMSIAFNNIPNAIACGGNTNPACSRVSTLQAQIQSYTTGTDPNQVFLNDYAASFTKMVNVGYGYTTPATSQVFTGKLGTLTYLDKCSF